MSEADVLVHNRCEGDSASSNTRIFRDATQEDVDLIDNIKKKYNAGKTRNAASAKGTIDGKK